MKCGRLRHQVVIKSIPETQSDTSGEMQEQAAATVATVWAEITPLSGRELWNAQQVQPDATHQIRMRYQSGLTAKHIVVFDSRTFRILEPPRSPDERQWEHVFLVKEEL